MEMIVTIFKSLGVDQTVFIQFVLLIVIFTLLSSLLFGKLQEVLDLRESKTVKLEGTAHAVYKKVEELQEQYKAKVEKTHQDSHLHSQGKKNEILKKEKDQLKEIEDKLAAEYEAKKSSLLAEVKTKKEKSLSEVDSLSKSLIEKLTK